MEVVAASAAHAAAVTPDPGPRSRPRLATILAALCALVLIAGVVLGLWLKGHSDEISQEEADRVAVMQAAERFVETWNTFTPQDAADYVDRVSPLLTTKFRTEFTDAAKDVVTGIQAQQLSSEGKVLVDNDGIPLVGIASLDDDSAEVFVVSDASRVAGGQQVLRQWRWQLSMTKSGGEWLVDDFSEV